MIPYVDEPLIISLMPRWPSNPMKHVKISTGVNFTRFHASLMERNLKISQLLILFGQTLFEFFFRN